MGGRLTEFDRYEKLTGWGTPRPVSGPKHSAMAIGSHLDDGRPKLAQQDVNIGGRGVEIALEWAIGNDSKHDLQVDYRIRLERHRGGLRNDETWFEYLPGKDVIKDIVSEKTGRAHKIITTHGASHNTKAKAIQIPAGRKTTISIGFTIPGPAQGRDLQKFWNDRKHSTFNLLVAVYQLTASGPVELEKGQHEFKDILELRVPDSFPTSVPSPSAVPRPTPQPTPELPGYMPRTPTPELPAIPYGKWDRTPGQIPAWAQKHWDSPDSGKVPTRRTKGGYTVQTYDPDTGDPW